MPSKLNHPALRSHLESQVNFMTELTHKTYDSVRKLSEMNLRLAQSLIEDGVATGRRMLACNDPAQVSALAMGQMQAVGEQLRRYQQQWLSMMAGVQIDLTRSAGSHLPDASRSAAAAAEEMARRSAELGQAYTQPPKGNGSAHTVYGNGAASDSAHHTPR